MSGVCIVGMHRSGTSVITGLLNAHGLNLGPEHQLLGSSPTNPTGHFEHTGILQINEALLDKFGGSWNCPPKLAPMWETGAELQGLAAEAAAHIRNLADRGPWGWKEPRTTMLLPFWQRLIPDLRYVICIRNPLEVAHSLVKRDGMTMNAGFELWRSYTRAALAHTNGRFRILTFYQDYFDNPLRELNRLANFCRLGKIDDLSRCAKVLTPTLRHHRHGAGELLFDPQVPLDCRLLYLRLRALQHLSRLRTSPQYGLNAT
jgi:hypothetical protein